MSQPPKGSPRGSPKGSPQLSPRGGGNGDSSKPQKESSGGFYGELMSYYYNGMRSVSSTLHGETRLPDELDTWVLGRHHNGQKTTEWVTKKVNCISYFTYRNRIPTPLSNGETHDAGWGCMIRTGQMMWHECLVRMSDRAKELRKMKRFGDSEAVKDTLSPLSRHADNQEFIGLSSSDIRSWFMDVVEAPYGLPALAECGSRHHIKVGEWFNPSSLSYVLVELAKAHSIINKMIQPVIAKDNILVKSEVLDILTGLDGIGVPRSVLVLVPIMLGAGGTISPQYQAPMTKFLTLPATLGIVGGTPKKSLYFVGFQGDSVFYLDPHVVQPAYVSEETQGNTIGPRGTAKVSTLDACCLLCFSFHSVEEFVEWEKEVTESIHPLSEYPVFTIGERPTVSAMDDDSMNFPEDEDDEWDCPGPSSDTPSTTTSTQKMSGAAAAGDDSDLLGGGGAATEGGGGDTAGREEVDEDLL